MAQATGTRPATADGSIRRVGLLRSIFVLPATGLCLGLILGAVLFAMATLSYRADVLIAPDPGSSAELQMRQVLSAAVLLRAAETEGLASDPAFHPASPGPLAGLLSAIGLDATTGESRPATVGRVLARSVTARRTAPDAIEISAEARDPDSALRLANAVARAAISLITEDRSALALQAAQREAVNRQTLHARLLEAEARLSLARRQPGTVFDPEAELSRANAAVADARDRLEEAKALAGGTTPAAQGGLRNPALERLRAQLADAMRAESLAAKTLGPRHPDMIEAQQQVRQARKMLADEARKAVDSARADLAAAENAAKLATRGPAANPSADSGPGDLRALESEVDARRAAYHGALRTHEQAQEGVSRTHARILAPATTSPTPSGWSGVQYLGVAGSLGLFAGAMLAAGRDLRRRRGVQAATSVMGPRQRRPMTLRRPPPTDWTRSCGQRRVAVRVPSSSPRSRARRCARRRHSIWPCAPPGKVRASFWSMDSQAVKP